MDTYTTRDEAIKYEIIEPLTDYAADHDIEAIADEVIDSIGEGVDYRFICAVEDDEFWEIVQKHAR